MKRRIPCRRTPAILWLVLTATATTGFVNAQTQDDPRRSVAPGPVSAWRGEENALDRNEKNSGTLIGGVSFVPAMAGQGFRFNGVDGAVNVPDSESLKITGSLTISAWLHVEAFPSAEQGGAMILFRGDDRGGMDPYHLSVNPSGRLMFVVMSPNNEAAEVTAPLRAGRFVFVTATLDAKTGRMRLYQNGAIVAETTMTFGPLLGDLDAGAYPGVGIGNHAGQGVSGFRYPFRGIIDELELYDRALSPTEVRAAYQAWLDVPALSRSTAKR